MSKRIKKCTLCRLPSEECVHLSIYVIGSEGVQCCLDCRMILTNVAKGIMSTASRAKKAGFSEAEKIHKTKGGAE